MITAERLREVLHYDPATGEFSRRTPTKRTKAGGVIGAVRGRDGYAFVCVDGRKYLAHRLAWLYVHGHWPGAGLDHINCMRSDNRLANLREASQSQNMGNTRRSRANTSGFKGVIWHAAANRWRATICHRHIGFFDAPEDAHAAYMAAAERIFGEFARAA